MTKSKIIGGKDRCDYRAMTNDELIEEAKYCPNTELCIALRSEEHTSELQSH